VTNAKCAWLQRKSDSCAACIAWISAFLTLHHLHLLIVMVSGEIEGC